MNRLIAAIDRERGIAKKNVIPWYIPEDERFFTDETKKYGGHALTAKRTYDTFGAPLADRHNYVLTHETTPIEGTELVHDLPKFLQDFRASGTDIWVIGGASLFQEVMELGYADELYLTHIEATFGCDRFFPEYEKDYEQVEKSELREQNGFIFTYAKYVKKVS